MSASGHITHECKVNSSSSGPIYKRFLTRHKDRIACSGH